MSSEDFVPWGGISIICKSGPAEVIEPDGVRRRVCPPRGPRQLSWPSLYRGGLRTRVFRFGLLRRVNQAEISPVSGLR